MRPPKLWLFLLMLPAAMATASTSLVYIGTYTKAGGRGIYALRFNGATGAMSEPFLAAEVESPAFLAFDPKEKFLYSVDEEGGAVNAFAIDPSSGMLNFLNRQPTDGTSTAHLGVDPSGRMLIAVNYGSGTVATYPLLAGGRIGPRAAFFAQRGPPGPNPARQKEDHPHSVVFSPDGRFAMICDLGVDRVFVYRLDPATAGLTPNDPAFAVVPPGSGPRHSVFSPDARFFYNVDEMGGTVCAFAYDAAAGALKLLHTYSTLPSDASGLNGSAEIALHPSGRWLYASNRDVHGNGRGSDSLAIFARNPRSGLLRRVEVVPCGGRTPRNFSLSPDGRWLLCAHQDSDDVSVFRVDAETGKLTPTDNRVKVSRPVCVLFKD